jgi:hypothetical protein
MRRPLPCAPVPAVGAARRGARAPGRCAGCTGCKPNEVRRGLSCSIAACRLATRTPWGGVALFRRSSAAAATGCGAGASEPRPAKSRERLRFSRRTATGSSNTPVSWDGGAAARTASLPVLGGGGAAAAGRRPAAEGCCCQVGALLASRVDTAPPKNDSRLRQQRILFICRPARRGSHRPPRSCATHVARRLRFVCVALSPSMVASAALPKPA